MFNLPLQALDEQRHLAGVGLLLGEDFPEAGESRFAGLGAGSGRKLIGELKPECAAAYYNRACTYRKDVDDIQQAIMNFTKAIELRSGYAEAYNNRGDLYECVGDYQQAIVDFTKAIELKPDYAMAYVNRGITYARLDNKSLLSIADIKKAVSLWHELVI